MQQIGGLCEFPFAKIDLKSKVKNSRSQQKSFKTTLLHFVYNIIDGVNGYASYLISFKKTIIEIQNYCLIAEYNR